MISWTKRFTITEDHLRLLRRANVTWDDTEFGAPEIDCKRPYGNSDVFADMAEILDAPDDDWVYENGERVGMTPDAEWRFLRLHVGTAAALQIALATGEFRTARYVRGNDWDTTWRRDEA